VNNLQGASSFLAANWTQLFFANLLLLALVGAWMEKVMQGAFACRSQPILDLEFAKSERVMDGILSGGDRAARIQAALTANNYDYAFIVLYWLWFLLVAWKCWSQPGTLRYLAIGIAALGTLGAYYDVQEDRAIARTIHTIQHSKPENLAATDAGILRPAVRKWFCVLAAFAPAGVALAASSAFRGSFWFGCLLLVFIGRVTYSVCTRYGEAKRSWEVSKQS